MRAEAKREEERIAAAAVDGEKKRQEEYDAAAKTQGFELAPPPGWPGHVPPVKPDESSRDTRKSQRGDLVFSLGNVSRDRRSRPR
jgi:hypothetical protein